MPTLKRRIVDQADGRYWALYGRAGVVDFRVMDFAEYGTRDVDSRAAVGMHSPRPHEHAEYPCVGCPFIEGACFVEMSDSGGVFIATEWESAGFDDEVIWRWLTTYYEEFFLGVERVVA
jgi:hypothetical protein